MVTSVTPQLGTLTPIALNSCLLGECLLYLSPSEIETLSRVSKLARDAFGPGGSFLKVNSLNCEQLNTHLWRCLLSSPCNRLYSCRTPYWEEIALYYNTPVKTPNFSKHNLLHTLGSIDWVTPRDEAQPVDVICRDLAPLFPQIEQPSLSDLHEPLDATTVRFLTRKQLYLGILFIIRTGSVPALSNLLTLPETVSLLMHPDVKINRAWEVAGRKGDLEIINILFRQLPLECWCKDALFCAATSAGHSHVLVSLLNDPVVEKQPSLDAINQAMRNAQVHGHEGIIWELLLPRAEALDPIDLPLYLRDASHLNNHRDEIDEEEF